MFQTLRKNKAVKNAGWIIGGKVSNKLLAFVVAIFAARYLGPSNYGLINYAAAYATFFASLCTLGINSVIVKNLVDHPEQVQVKTVDNPESVIIELSVGPDDMGKVIGKQGRIAKSIRSVVKAATARSEKPVFVEIL